MIQREKIESYPVSPAILTAITGTNQGLKISEERRRRRGVWEKDRVGMPGQEMNERERGSRDRKSVV